jgi:two-component system, chemotaxis family, CheB/CheR fusion protein
VSDERSFSHLVVIGSSAGGIEALSELVSTLPEDFPAPIVAVQHLSPDRESHLEQILMRRSTVPVMTLKEQTTLPLESGVVFVVPADRHVNITDHEIVLQEDNAGRPKPSIDLIFESAAEMYGDRLIAVVLTGSGSDGTAGARTVKKAGGTVVIQNPETAAHPEMPRSLAPTTVDIVADLEGIGTILNDLLAGIEVPTEPDEKKRLESFLAEVRTRHGIDFTSYKTPTIMRRLQRRVVATGSGDLDGYRRHLEEHPEEYQQLVNAFLIKVTEFFRDRELFDYLRGELIPELVEKARAQDNQLRIWSAGCATGEEPYSLAMLISEALGDESEHFSVRIFATDLDEEAVNFARQGLYPEDALAGLPEDFINHYFIEEDDGYQVKKRVRTMIVFGQHDLAQRAPFPRIDLVLCRNVMIYFTKELQKRTLQLFAYSLRDGGYLLLGKSETPSPLSEYFSLHDKKHKIYRRQGERFLIVPPARTTDPTPLPQGRSLPAARLSASSSSTQERRQTREGHGLEDDFVLRFPVGVVVVDRKYDIRSINAAARHLLSISDPAVGEDLLHTVQGAHYAELRAAIDVAFREGRASGVAEFAIEEVATGEQRFLQLTCHPQRDESEVESVMVVVSDVTGATRARLELEDRLSRTAAELERLEQEAQEERERQATHNRQLVEANRHLTEANQELTRLNAELESTSEQYLISNEESQAAAEEVEALNEELQATNEELETLNEELQATIEELNTTNEDLNARSAELREYAQATEEERARLQTILESMSEAVLVVNAAGRTVLANAAYQRLIGSDDFNILDTLGEPLSSDRTPWGKAARGESSGTEFVVEDEAGTQRRFKAEGRPIGSSEDNKGGVIVFHEVTDDDA